MKEVVSLAPKTIGKVRRKQRLKIFINRSIIWAGVGLSLILIIISSWSILINRHNLALENQIKQTETAIVKLQPRESQQVYLSSKLAVFADLIKSHEVHQKMAETIFNLLPGGISLNGFQVNETGVIALVGSAPNWSVFSQLLMNLQQFAGEPLSLQSVAVKQINFDQEGVIVFDLELGIKL
jgi:Tfp pilus assembly protein PilN